MKTRSQQYSEYLSMLTQFQMWIITQNLPVRQGEAQRPSILATLYAKIGTGIANSKHCYSLAMDFWVYNSKGSPIMSSKDEGWVLAEQIYTKMGDKWKSLNGVWGGDFKKRDLCHFEYYDQPSKY